MEGVVGVLDRIFVGIILCVRRTSRVLLLSSNCNGRIFDGGLLAWWWKVLMEVVEACFSVGKPLVDPPLQICCSCETGRQLVGWLVSLRQEGGESRRLLISTLMYSWSFAD